MLYRLNSKQTPYLKQNIDFCINYLGRSFDLSYYWLKVYQKFNLILNTKYQSKWSIKLDLI